MAEVGLPPPDTRECFRFAGFILDAGGWTLMRTDGREVPLTRSEFALLLTFLRAPTRVLSRDQLLDAVAGRRSDPFDRSVDVLVSRVRHKIEPEPRSPRLIRTVPGIGYKFAETPEAKRTSARGTEPPHGEPFRAPPEKPSIAVLPFRNMSGDAAQEYFADGVTEEIITALSRIRSFSVIARQSCFAYKGKSPDVREVGRALGARYVLEGSVRTGGGRLRITAQLVDATDGVHVWAERFEGALSDLFALQDRITSRVIGAVEPKLEQIEIERARRKPAEDLQAYDLVLRSRFAQDRWTREGIAESRALLERAVALDPDYPLALALLSLSHYWLAALFYHKPTAAEVAGYARMAREALERAPDEPEVLLPAAVVIAMTVDQHEGLEVVSHALSLNPNCAQAWAQSGMARAYIGDTKGALADLERSRQFCPPHVRVWYQHCSFGLAHFVDGRYEEALRWWDAHLRRVPNALITLRYAAAALGLLGRIEEAGAYVRPLLAATPGVTLARVRYHIEVVKKNPFGRPGVAEALYEGLRRAGLPE